MSDQSRNLPHLYLSGNGESENYTSRGEGGAIQPPIRDREDHATALQQALNQAINEARQNLNSRDPEIAVGNPGFYLEFQIHSDNMNVFESLESKRKNIELVAVRKSSDQEDVVEATVFVPESSSEHFLSKVEQYRSEETRFEKPKNETLVSRIESVQIGTVRSLFTDKDELFPQDTQSIWWEVWLRKDQSESFKRVTERLNIVTKQNVISFPEREVMLTLANLESMTRIINNSDVVAELRKAKDSPSFFLDMGPREQEEWSRDLENRLSPPQDDAVSICLLDSGVAQIHPLITPALELADMHTCNPNWGVNDNNACGHGTKMAGLALYSDLFKVLQTSQPIYLSHRLESVKILPPTGQNEPELYGAITEQAISLPEIQAPNRLRLFCMAVTNTDISPNTGSPSSWSAAIDQLCFGDGEFRRLIIISGGNIREDILPANYLDINDVSSIENPCQAWNPLVIGAYTEKVNVVDPRFAGFSPVAPAGDLSPRSRTSVSWSDQWSMIRPDVVFEGGNLASDRANPAIYMDDLCLLTTHHRPNFRVFDRMGDTSSATALASYMAAQIMSKHPNYNPETVRALMVHSAEWTPVMQALFKNANRKSEMRTFLRRYGYGVPDLNRALQSANNDLTLIVEDDLQPFRLDDDNNIKTRYMKFHQLPWPREELEKLVEASVELKVTLSYFIEPNPGERGWGRRHQYASHGLRFKVKRPSEDDDTFRKRINKAATDEEEKLNSTRKYDEDWFLGEKNRNHGSIHSDIWYGSAADLAQRGAIAVYPVGGWWKENKTLERWNNSVRYSLIVSIRVPSLVEVDIYTPVANLIAVPVAIPIS
ncbi:MAG: S8 family peptidase [Pseudanabaenaceae cyanobacterium]|jgi:Subtilase family